MNENNNQQKNQDTNNPAFGMQRVFMKKSLMEVFQTPEIFKQAWEPVFDLTMNTSSKKIENEDGIFISSLVLEVLGMLNDKEAFKISVETQGIFQIRGVEPEMVERALSIICPTMLFPYARETIDSLMVKASLPPMMLAPMDFEAIYEESLRKKADEKAQKDNLTQGDSYKPKGGI